MTITALQFNQLPDIDDAMLLDDADMKCLEEVQDVLSRHGKALRFSVGLIHKHFDISENEILLETCDPINRQLICRPVDRSVLESAKVVATNWINELGVSRGCEKVCPTDSSGRHYGYSDHVIDEEG